MSRQGYLRHIIESLVLEDQQLAQLVNSIPLCCTYNYIRTVLACGMENLRGKTNRLHETLKDSNNARC